MSEPVNQTVNVTVGGNVSGCAVNVSNTTVNNKHTHHHQHEHTHHIRTTGPVIVHKTVVHQELAFALQALPAPPARQRRQTKTPARDITPSQREVLALMRPLPKPDRVDVLIWMRMEFGTSLVVDLDPRELHRLRPHLLGVRRAAGVVGG